MAKYRAIKLGPTRWGWHIQKKVLFVWKDVDRGRTEAEAREILEFYAGVTNVIYPSRTRAGDPLGIRGEDTQ